METIEKKVLLVEDNRADATMLKETLTAACPGEFKVVWAETLEQTIEWLREERFDAILLDLWLPDSHGAATVERVLGVAPAVPVVILSGASDEQVAAGAVRRGAQDYLVKGETDGRSVARALQYAIDRKAIEKTLRQQNEDLTAIEGALRRQKDELLAARSVIEHERSRYLDLFESAPDGYVVTDAAGVILEANAAACRMLAFPMADLKGTSLSDFMSASDWTTHRNRLAALGAGGTLPAWEVEVRPEQGGPFWAVVTTSVSPEGERGPHNIRWLIHDIRLRKQAEAGLQEARDGLERKVRERTEELHRANQMLRAISDCNEVLIRAVDEESLIRDTCRIIVEMGGYRMAWIGYPVNDEARTVRPAAAVGFEGGYLEMARISWADNELGRGPTGTCLRTGEVRIGRDFQTDPELAPWREAALAHGYRSSIAIPLKDGGKVFGALTLYATDAEFFDGPQATLLRELADDLAFGILALRARTELVRSRALAERRSEQLRALALQLTEAEQTERRRLARILHDHLQQLLVGAKFGVGAIKAKIRARALQETLRQLNETLDEAIKASRTLTADLSPPILYEKGLVAGLEWLVRQMQEKHRLKVTLRVDGFPDLDSEHLRTFLYEAVRELLFNTVKHAGADEAEIRLSRADAESVRIVVQDNGEGFDPMLLEARQAQGGGFGLFSIRERLAYLGGSLEVESAPGQGSRFTLLAPIHAAKGFAKSDQAAESAPGGEGEGEPPVLFPTGRKIRVLLADDHAVLRQGLAAILADQADIELVGQASDGVMAVDMARQLRPDVIIMDVTMPRLDGVEATRKIAGEMPEVRVIGLSLHEPADMAASMREAGARAYLNKGGPAEELIAAIRAS
jgi:PAS domain S-box-containing protein